MTAEEKQLLLIDLSARLPYWVKVKVTLPWANDVEFASDIKIRTLNACLLDVVLDNDNPVVKPYLRPMSSMTDDEKKEIEEILEHSFHVTDKGNIVSNDWRDGAVFTSQYDAFKIMDFCNKHHLDCRELIPMSLALEAPKDMYIK